ncbi:aminoglycoside phosphotransferase family protein [Agromyces sp. NPDC056523]|uniref:aminoglycoside phosphotransferase family protein n=1 Tax=Agromyces sp. NPDC056523 TaxID=3345850 RepID=UPI00366DE5DF
MPVRPIEPGGVDHRSFRLGEDLLIRIPSAPGYVPQVAKEQAWLPVLGPRLPLPIPRVVGGGEPSDRISFPWSLYGWIDGETAMTAPIDDEVRFAEELAAFLVALRCIDATDGPGPGLHCAYRGAPVSQWDDEVHAFLPRIGDARERARAAAIWRDAVSEPDRSAPVWFHGDVARANLLVREGRLSAVIDFGCAGVGDPACDTVMAWTAFSGASRRAFVHVYDVDDATWARGRGWALWKALIQLDSPDQGSVDLARRTLAALFEEGASGGLRGTA